ncbi:MAG: hypothetical protein JSR17_09250 [Proteobacteria bacterium]|nr:hypothetical protein [Pseudomonadota bacterium]
MVDLVYGPLNKNLFTQMVELVTKCLIYAPNEVKLFSKQENKFDATPSDLHAKVGNIEVNLTSLLSKANMSHVQFNETDSNALLQNLNNIYYHPVYPHEQGCPITQAEQNAVTNYTGSGYWSINNFLYNGAKCPSYFQDAKDVFLNTVFLSSALNKITPDCCHFETYRGEHSTPFEEILERISLVEQGGGITDQVAFQSTSSSKWVSEGFKGNCMIIFEDAYGKSVQSYSCFPGEQEYLLSPGKILWTSYEYKDGCHTFHAQVVNPLVEGADKANDSDYKLFYQLLNFAEKHNISDDFVTPQLKTELNKEHGFFIKFPQLFQNMEAKSTDVTLKLSDCIQFSDDAIPGLDAPISAQANQVSPTCSQQALEPSACVLANMQILPQVHQEVVIA